MSSITSSKSESFLRSACIDAHAHADAQGVVSPLRSFDAPPAGNRLPALSPPEFHPFLTKTLLSLPLMKPIINVVKKYDSIDGLEDELICVLTDAMQDPSNPWFQLRPKSPPLYGPRTPEQYLAALDIAINARKDMNRNKKIAQYWKQQALRGVLPNDDSVLLTPSPSDVSVSGFPSPLPSPRRDRLNELIARRKGLSDSDRNLDSGAVVKEVDDLLASLRALERDDKGSAAVASSCTSTTPMYDVAGSVSQSDATLVNLKEEIVPIASKIPAPKRQGSVPGSPDNLTQVIGTPSPSRLLLKTHTCCKTPGTVQSTPRVTSGVPTSVQSKRQLYESLALRPLGPPVLTSTPGAKPRPVRPRKSTVATAQSRLFMVTERKIPSKTNATTQRRKSASSNDPR